MRDLDESGKKCRVAISKIDDSLLRCEGDKWYEHLLQGNAAMLECTGIVLHVIVVVVGIREEILIGGEDERA